MTSGDTIAAFATGVAPAARTVLRTSGPAAIAVASELCGELPTSAGRVTLAFADLACPAWVYVFRAPRSYTGEDVVEYGLPGSPVLARLLHAHLLARGLRQAEPGEFTARAYFAGKLDLTEAEGVAATIAAGNAAELAAARQLLAGELARRLRPITDSLADALALVEVGIDFAEDDVTVLAVDELRQRIATADAALAELVADGDRFEALSHQPRVVLAGRPNAGKSSLLNALAGRDRAVVSPVAGTTRDVLSATVDLPRGRVQLIDAAGLDEPDPDSPASALDEIAEAMRSGATDVIASADVVVLVRDATDARPDVPLPRPPDVRVTNKVDLTDGFAGVSALTGAAPESLAPSRLTAGDVPAASRDGASAPEARPTFETVRAAMRGRDGVAGVSALTGAGMDGLRATLDAAAFGRGGTAGRLALNGRHRSALGDARAALARAAAHADVAELAAADLRSALDTVGSVVGSVTPDDVLGRIFGSFCIGK